MVPQTTFIGLIIIFKNKILKIIDLTISIQVGYTGVGVLFRDVGVGQKSSQDKPRDADDVRVGGYGQNFPIDSL